MTIASPLGRKLRRACGSKCSYRGLVKNLRTLAGDCGGKPRRSVNEKPPNPVGTEEENRKIIVRSSS